METTRHHLVGRGADRRVWLDGRELLPGPSQRVYNHSPDGFNWGYGGSGPAQLALAVCLRLTGDRDLSFVLYPDFKWRVIAGLPLDFDIWFDWPPVEGQPHEPCGDRHGV